MKRLDIDFKANHANSDYSWKMFCKCASAKQLQAMKAAINLYMDTKIAEAEKEDAENA